jgi:hypothetical protein
MAVASFMLPFTTDSRPNKGTPDGRDLRAAIGAVLAGKSVPEPQRPSIGCSIKWK